MGTQGRKRTLLVIDDDKSLCSYVSDYFHSDAIEVLLAHTAQDGLALCSQKEIDVVLLDQRLPDAEGHTLCQPILNHNDQTKIIFTTAYPSFDNARKAIKAGAFDYLAKPFETGELDHVIKQSLRTLDLERVEQLGKYKDNKEIEDAILIGDSMAFHEIKKLVTLSASSDAPVLITGETGTGKNVVAKSIHFNSPVPKTTFISINCAALPENLIEAELFGYEKGSFTGATAAKRGLVEMAEGGTLFLDEIGEMPFHLQSKFLGVLDEKKVKRLGGETFRPVGVRIIAATNSNLSQAIKEKKFREDLFYRLSVIRIHLLPLRERREDIPGLCHYLMRRLDNGRGLKISESEISEFMKYDWPGNVRELRNIIERAVLLHQGNSFRPSELLKDSSSHPETLPAPASPEIGGDVMTLREIEKNHIQYALEKHSYQYSMTARALGISFSTLKRKIKSYHLV